MRLTMRAHVALALLALMPFASAARADVPPRSQLAIGLAGAVPVGDFADGTRDLAPGLDIGARVRLDRRGEWALRIDGGTRLYGERRFRLPIAKLPGQTAALDVNTALSNLDVGLQRGFGAGRLRPYLFATGGLAHFWVSSAFPDVSYQPFEFEYRSNAFEWSAGGGLRRRIGGSPQAPEVDLSVAWRSVPSARYVRAADVSVMSGALVDVRDRHARAELVDVRLTFHGGGRWGR
jgi:hypothetical protein